MESSAVADAVDSVDSCYLESSAVSDAEDYCDDDFKGRDTFIEACSSNDITSDKGVDYCSIEASAVADVEDAGAAEEFDRFLYPCYAVVADDSADDVTEAAAKAVAYSIYSFMVDSEKGPCSAEYFAGVFPLRLVRVCFLFFGHIVYTQCHRYRSNSYQFTVKVNIAFHK